jgi:hypothetical protein
MAKKLDSVIYELKATNPNAVANFNAGQLIAKVGEDLETHCGRPIQGVAVKANEAMKLVEQAKKDLVGKKVQQPHFRAGICGKDLIFLVTDLKNAKYEQFCVLNAGYTALRDKLANQKGAVVNLDPGDSIVDQASKDMGDALGIKPLTEGRAPFGKLKGTKPLVLVAHGDEDITSTGQIYGKNFAGKTPAEIVKMLLDNPDQNKQLSPDYEGTIYLDGCFTAQGGAMENYTKQVWDLLKARGLKKVKVKGNLGAAEVKPGGDNIITTTEAEEKAKKMAIAMQKVMDGEKAKMEQELKEAQSKLTAAQTELKKLQSARANVWSTTFKATNDQAGFLQAPLVKKIDESITGSLNPKINTLSKQVADLDAKIKGLYDIYLAKLKADIAKIPGYEVKNLVGQFGLEFHR